MKDNLKGYWFKAKPYGWGWTPVKWQGFVVIVFYILAVIKIASMIDGNSHSVSDALYGVTLPIILLTILLLVICYKTGERPHWMWRLPENKKEEDK